MTDVTAPAIRTIDVATDAARARIRARYRAERRFRFYGVAAIGVTAIFLVVVLTDIFIKGLPAFTQHELNMQVKVDAAEIDPQGTRDLSVIRGGDYQALVREALRSQFPEVTDRPGRKLLDGIRSGAIEQTVGIAPRRSELAPQADATLRQRISVALAPKRLPGLATLAGALKSSADRCGRQTCHRELPFGVAPIS